jgi:hypothetical protein
MRRFLPRHFAFREFAPFLPNGLGARAHANAFPDHVDHVVDVATVQEIFVLNRRVRPNLPDDPPWATPLAWATRRGHLQFVELLKQHVFRSDRPQLATRRKLA